MTDNTCTAGSFLRLTVLDRYLVRCLVIYWQTRHTPTCRPARLQAGATLQYYTRILKILNCCLTEELGVC